MTQPTQPRMKELHGKPIAFPDVRTFAELFPSHKAHQAGAPPLLDLPSWDNPKNTRRGNRFHVGSYLFARFDDEHRSFTVAAAPAVLDYVRNEMLHVSNDTTYFEVIPWSDGRALVTISHGQIIGSRYLAVIDAATIPAAAVEVPK